MSIRIRWSRGRLVALCAAKTESHMGDLYLDEGMHHALYRKFEADFIREERILQKRSVSMRKQFAAAMVRHEDQKA